MPCLMKMFSLYPLFWMHCKLKKRDGRKGSDRKTKKSKEEGRKKKKGMGRRRTEDEELTLF